MADADTIYRVLTVYDAETRAAEQSVGGLAIVFDHLINLIERAGHLLHSVWELDAAAESAQIAMAGLMNAARFPGADDFNRSMVMSSELMKIMRTDAAALSGTYEQMQAIFQATIPVAHEAGQSLISAEKLSGRVMEFGNTFKIPAEFIGREFRQMMEGRASVRNALFKDLSMFMGNISGQDFNTLASPEKWQKVTEALAHFDPMFKKVGETGTAQLTTMESYFNQLVRIGSGGMFDGLKHELKEINEWYTKHQEQVDEIAKKLGKELGEGLAHGFAIAKDAIAFIVAHREAIKNIAEAFLLFKGLSMMGGGFSGSTGVAGAKGLEFGNVLGGGAFGLAIAQATGQTNLLNRSMMVTEGAMGTLPGPIGMVAKGLLGLHAVLGAFADKVEEKHAEATKAEGELSALQSEIRGGNAGAVLANLRGAGLLNKDGSINLGQFAAQMARESNTAAMGFHTMSAAEIGTMAGRAQALIGTLRDRAQRDERLFGPAAPTAEQRAQQLLYEQSHALAPKGDTNINIHIEQTLHDADDPERVYVSTVKALRDARIRPATTAKGMVLR
jgi:hypothetical protein